MGRGFWEEWLSEEVRTAGEIYRQSGRHPFRGGFSPLGVLGEISFSSAAGLPCGSSRPETGRPSLKD